MTVSVKAAASPVAVRFFPLHRRTDIVRQAAEDLDRHQGQAAVDFWRTTCRRLGAELLESGCPEHAMRAQIMDFQAAVQMALMDMHRERVAIG